MKIDFTLTQNNLDGLVSQLRQLDPTQRYSVQVRLYKSKRSTEQNRRYWKLVTGLGKHIGHTPDEMHDMARFKFLRNAIEIQGERLPLLNSTTKLTTAEMADYQDSIERWGEQLGFWFEE